MCDTLTMNRIAEVVDEWILDEKMFTAYEVSREVQRRERSVGRPITRHRDMRNDIHQELDKYIYPQGDYEKTLVQVTPSEKALLFHLPEDDPDAYQNSIIDVKGSTPTTPQPSTTTTPTTVAVAPTSKTNTSPLKGNTVDARGSLTMPAKLLRRIGLRPGDTAEVNATMGGGKNSLVVRPQTGGPGYQKPVTSYTVNKSNNFRVTAKTLKKAQLNGPRYNVFVNPANEIVIENA